MEEFEEELRRILIPENSTEGQATERILGGWKNEKNGCLIIPPSSYLLAFYLSTLPRNYQNNNNARPARTKPIPIRLNKMYLIDIQYDSERYFISGFSSEVTVFLTGLISDIASAESTRKFRVTADLTQAEGTVEVPPSHRKFTKRFNSLAAPQKITVKIGKSNTG